MFSVVISIPQGAKRSGRESMISSAKISILQQSKTREISIYDRVKGKATVNNGFGWFL